LDESGFESNLGGTCGEVEGEDGLSLVDVAQDCPPVPLFPMAQLGRLIGTIHIKMGFLNNKRSYSDKSRVAKRTNPYLCQVLTEEIIDDGLLRHSECFGEGLF